MAVRGHVHTLPTQFEELLHQDKIDPVPHGELHHQDHDRKLHLNQGPGHREPESREMDMDEKEVELEVCQEVEVPIVEIAGHLEIEIIPEAGVAAEQFRAPRL